MSRGIAKVSYFRLPNGKKVFFKRFRPVRQCCIRYPDVVPASLAGRYVAWSPNGLHILGSGATIAEARANAGDRTSILIQRIPPSNRLRSSIDATGRPAEGPRTA